jgi:5-oxoprolinase (ATP-hydrolysing)
MINTSQHSWQFWIDRGGTFTDIVAKGPDGQIIIHKVLSENPERYQDAPVEGIREILGLKSNQPIPRNTIEVIKMGTTVATNALLERKGDRVLLLITKGFKDALRIGYQNRPNIFARHIILPEMLYEQVIEVEERYSAQGEILTPLKFDFIPALQQAYQAGIKSCAIIFMHGYKYPQHEKEVAQIAQEIGFTQISISHEVSPLMKLVSRGDTTVVDAYLSPILRRYVNQFSRQLKGDSPRNYEETEGDLKLMFMQSNGGLVNAAQFQGKNSILSGPAGGIVGAVKTSELAGFDKIITFDMGGTSTDVAHYNGEYERQFETEIAGIRTRSAMMSIHTVAAGGGSILFFDGSRYRVGPESAGANPGPASYRKGGPLTVTDCNVMLGKIQPEFFPKVFGIEGNLPLDAEIVKEKFSQLAAQIGDKRTPEKVAAGFLAIAVEKMANAIKKISLQRGYDVSEYTLCCFGGAGGQHACLIADALGMKQVFIHPYAGVLSAYGMGLADVRVIREKSCEQVLNSGLIEDLKRFLEELERAGKEELNHKGTEGTEKSLEVIYKVYLKYQGSDSTLGIDFRENLGEMQDNFQRLHRQRYGFLMAEKALIAEAVSVEVIEKMSIPEEVLISPVEWSQKVSIAPVTTIQMWTGNVWQETPVYQRDNLTPGMMINGPAIIIETTGTNVIEVGWQAQLTCRNHLILTREGFSQIREQKSELQNRPDPVLLEIFNNLFKAIAEQMGITLQNTSSSVNIKERLDFSCAIFDENGQLVANAPHIPVHLGSMSESVTALIKAKGDNIKPGDVYVSNNPYNGGTHLPDITVITPVFANTLISLKPLFYVASRGHHADIGGITPGSMPPHSKSVTEEGILFDNFQLVSQGKLRESELLEILNSSEYPARNIHQNLADLQAQIAANECGVKELLQMVGHYGLETVKAYMKYVQDNAEESVRRVIEVLKDGEYIYPMDGGGQIQVKITIEPDSRSAKIDFTGTSPQQNNNFNAPAAVCKAAVLYVFRTLVDDDIPLNAGCLKPLEIIIPEGCMLNPNYPAAVVAGNVETSQNITDALYGALGIMAASQGTMNNFTFGNANYQYYETICGGSGAGANFPGTDAVQTNMTNSRLTDPEVLEWRFPVLLESFEIRANSGGKGKYDGGNGVIRKIKFREAMIAGILSGRRVIPPYGLKGGENGNLGQNSVQRVNGEIELLGSTATVEMEPGDIFMIETPGGGGWGWD